MTLASSCFRVLCCHQHAFYAPTQVLACTASSQQLINHNQWRSSTNQPTNQPPRRYQLPESGALAHMYRARKTRVDELQPAADWRSAGDMAGAEGPGDGGLDGLARTVLQV